MGKAVLVTEGDSLLGAALVRLFASKGCAVMTTSSAAEPGPARTAGRTEQAVKVVTWNRRSPLSARNLLLSVLNAFDGLDEAFILEPPSPFTRPLAEASSAEIEAAYDDAKGPAFLAREVLGCFAERSSGLLALVSPASSAGALASALREGFRGLAGSLLSAPAPGGVVVNGFQAAGEGPEDFAAFIDRTLDEKARRISGHWFVLQPRGGFLQGMFSPSVKKA